MLTILPLLLLWIVWDRARSRSEKLRASATFLLGAALVVSPFVARNLVVYDTALLLSDSHGANLLIGHNPDANGGYIGPDPKAWCPGPSSRSGTISDADATSCALDYAWSHPLQEARLLGEKALRFWRPIDGPWSNNWRHPLDPRRLLPTSIRESRTFHDVDAMLTVAWMAASLALVVLGAIVAARRRRRGAALVLVIVCWLFAAHLVTFSDPRFRIPILPFITILQSIAIVAIIRHLRARSRRDKSLGTSSPTAAG